MAGSIELLGITGFVAVAMIDGFAAYWALGIRHALAVHIYRNQILGIALVSITFAAFTLVVTVIQWYPQNSNPFFPPLFLLAFITLFFWVDASIRAGRRSDPLLRDVVHWRVLRVLLWVLIIVLPMVTTMFQALAFTQLFDTIVNVTIPFVFFAPLLCGTLLLPIVARRSGDFTLRRHLQWFALFALTYLVLTLSSVLVNLQVFTPLEVTWVSAMRFLAGYFLYRSGRALVPLNRLSLDQ